MKSFTIKLQVVIVFLGCFCLSSCFKLKNSNSASANSEFELERKRRRTIPIKPFTHDLFDDINAKRNDGLPNNMETNNGNDGTGNLNLLGNNNLGDIGRNRNNINPSQGIGGSMTNQDNNQDSNMNDKTPNMQNQLQSQLAGNMEDVLPKINSMVNEKFTDFVQNFSTEVEGKDPFLTFLSYLRYISNSAEKRTLEKRENLFGSSNTQNQKNQQPSNSQPNTANSQANTPSFP